MHTYTGPRHLETLRAQGMPWLLLLFFLFLHLSHGWLNGTQNARPEPLPI